MHLIYLSITVMAALADGYAAVLNFAGAESVEVVADRVRLSRSWMIPFGVLLATGAIGLLVGTAVPLLGQVAAIGLLLYFVCAVGAHVRARDTGVGGAIFFLVLAAGALVANLAYRGHW
ncbi:MAG TPA: DoxX family protein [Nocardioides sp.]|uniref:DoxX family protein n=1 Tax=Nocardioides sp. TaxID=35761 RepID=UPI002F3F2B4B